MNWNHAADVVPDLLKLELVRSDDRFSLGVQEVLQVGSNQDVLLELRKIFGELAQLKKDRKTKLKRNAEARKTEKENEEKEKGEIDPDWSPSKKK